MADCGILGQIKNLVNQLDCSPCGPCCPPEPDYPYATCCMVTPPPILAPTSPSPVKPLQLPCPRQNQVHEMSQEEAERTRYANFYNNYNIVIGWDNCTRAPDPYKDRCQGACVDGKSPCCEDYRLKRKRPCEDKGCPTGFLPCTMKMTPPPGCHPCGVWDAKVMPCPPKRKSKVSRYTPGPCRRPCCKHWKPKDGTCKYDKPCKAHCYDHPPNTKGGKGHMVC